MRDKYHPAGIKSMPGSYREQLIDDRDIEIRLPGKYPEIRSIRAGHQGILVGFTVQIDDVIAAVKRAEK